jgi:hypothetical protein
MRHVHVLFVALFALTGGACAPEEAPARGRADPGKADSLGGTCAGSDCSGPGQGGDCYCDESCAGFGDCCADRDELCGAGSDLEFTISRVSSEHDIGNEPTIHFAPDGAVRIGYYDFDNTGGDLRIARPVHAGWSSAVLTDADDHLASPRSSFVQDPAGTHVVYRNRTGLGTVLVYRRALDGTSSPEVVPSEAGRNPSLALAADGTVHVVSLSEIDAPGTPLHSEVRHAWRDPEGWHSEVIAFVEDPLSAWADLSELVIDSDGAQHVAFSSPADDMIHHAVRRGAAPWVISPVAAFEASGRVRPRLALGPDGGVHIAFTSGAAGERMLVHASGRGAGFASEAVPTSGAEVAGNAVAIAVDPAGGAHLAFQADLRLHHAVVGGGPAQLVDQAFQVGSELSIAIGGDGRVHIAYRDEALDDLKYATAQMP